MAYGNNLFQSYMTQPQTYQQPIYYSQNPQYYPQQMTGSSCQPTTSSNMLNGKIVDSEDMVRIQEIPLGGYGIYPKADMSNIYLKTWNNDGTTRVISYVPIVESNEIKDNSTQDKFNYQESINKLYDAINRLEKKFDDLMS